MFANTFTRPTTAFLAALLVAIACDAPTDASSSDEDGAPTPPPSGEPGRVSGRIVDTRGQPIVGARVWVRPALTTGLLQATTDAEGRYSVQGIATLPYHAYAWHFVTFRGKQLCMRLAANSPDEYDSFVPTQGAVRNFKWQLAGEIEANSGSYFGGELRVFQPAIPPGSKLRLTLAPDGPLVDGSAGRALEVDPADWDLVVENIPLGVYKVSAAFVAANGARTPLEVSADGAPSSYGAQAMLQWESSSSCVGSSGSGPDRAFVWVRAPGDEG